MRTSASSRAQLSPPRRPGTGRRLRPFAVAALLTAAIVTAGCGGGDRPAGTATAQAGTGTTAAPTVAPTTATATGGATTGSTPPASSPTTVVTAAWTAMARSPLPKLVLVTGAWDGRELLVVGAALTKTGSLYAAAAAYTPSTDRWRSLPAPTIPSTQGSPSAVWTGHELFVWGGGFHHALNPVTGTWRQLSGIDGAPYGGGFALVWTGRLVLGWGGGCCGGNVDTGAAYDPATDRWTTLPPSPLSGRYTTGAWTGTELIIAGGSQAEGQVFADAAAYNPTTRSWRRLPSMPTPRAGATATWVGDRLVVAGGYSALPMNSHLVRGLAIWSPATGTWRTVTGPEAGRSGHGAVWTGRQLLIWGGGVGFGDSMVPAPHGLAYTPATGLWTALPLSPLRGRSGPVMAWTGRQLLVWGGPGVSDGARYTL